MLVKVIVPITNPLLKKFTDLKSIEIEMERLKNFCDFIKSTPEVNPANVDMLMSAAVVKYLRAFSGGMREKLNPEVIFKNAVDLNMHNYLFSYRNKHLAHSVNDYEEPVLFAELSVNENGVREVSSFYPTSQIVALNKKQLAPLIHLIEHVLSYLWHRIQELYPIISEQIYSLSQSELNSLKEAPPFKFNPDEIEKKRSGSKNN